MERTTLSPMILKDADTKAPQLAELETQLAAPGIPAATKQQKQGEFSIWFAGKPRGIPSPLEQNERHIAAGKGAGGEFRMSPKFGPYFLWPADLAV